MMNRYLIFAGMTYYPGEGLEDYCGSLEEIESAKSFAKAKMPEHYGWCRVYDRDTLQLAYKLKVAGEGKSNLKEPTP